MDDQREKHWMPNQGAVERLNQACLALSDVLGDLAATDPFSIEELEAMAKVRDDLADAWFEGAGRLGNEPQPMKLNPPARLGQ